jgi:hypothetical protein
MILKHALEENGKCTRAARMQWLDSKGNINIHIPALRYAKEELAAISRPTHLKRRV